MSETALVVVLPELEPLIGGLRRRYTGDGARGMPPHVTLIYPFWDTSAVEERLESVARVLGAFAPFEIELCETARFPDLVYLRPQPSAPFVAMTEALAEAFPEFAPYGGEFDEIVPHATVAQGDEKTLAAVEKELVRQLPVKTRCERAWLVEHTPAGWRRHTAFPLERRTSV
jgi:2'-5' RNA ligase